MSSHNLKLWIRTQALVVRAQGYEAENRYRESCGKGIAYGEEAFLVIYDELEHLARSVE